MELIHLNIGSPAVRLLANGRYHTFEMHRYCGPMKLKADGETEAKNYWSEKSDFWPVFEQWVKAGKQVDKHGIGIIK